MKKCIQPLFLLMLVFVAFPTSLVAAESFRKSQLEIYSGERVHRFDVEIAETANQRALGLQWRESMASDQGMLFNFKLTTPVTMWMKNTRLSLDMLFISENGTIVNIARDTEPLSLAYINSVGPVKAVFEVLAGTARRLNIKAGDKVGHQMFGN